MRAGEAARRQGIEAFEAFQLALLKARHEDRKDLASDEVVLQAALDSGLDAARFREDLADQSILHDLGASHTRAVEEYGVFGVPTFIFPNGNSAFLKTYQPPEGEAVEMFDAILNVMGRWNYVGEVKRPQPPWPKGVFA
jgi:predicted DsbA family dithiol-disulfide isomerase